MSDTLPSVKETVFQILRNHGVDKVFGNPGSNELHFLRGFPEDFEYILCLDEGVVIGVADGYAQATGQPAFVNLHSAAGTGNAMGGLANARNSHSPIVVTAGQQARTMVYADPMLKNSDATMLPRPLVKDSFEPLSHEEVPHSINRALNSAMAPAKGPVYVSIPYDDWEKKVSENALQLVNRRVSHCGAPDKGLLERVSKQIQVAKSPVLILGPEVDSERCNALVAKLAEKLHAPAWVAPSAPRCPFPTGHRCFAGILPAGEAALCSHLQEHDLVIVIGGPVFRYHQNDPGTLIPDHAKLIHITSDSDEAARAPIGEAIVASVKSFVEALYDSLPPKQTECPSFRKEVRRNTSDDAVLSPETVYDVVDDLSPRDSIYLNEATSTLATLWSRVTMEYSGSYYFAAAGGLGFAMPAALGVQLASPERKVVAFIGDGSAHYSIAALWTAAKYNIPVVYVVINNKGYSALKWFADLFGVDDAVPGLTIEDVDFVKISEGYGVKAVKVNSVRDFKKHYKIALNMDRPFLIEVIV
ncbi:benzoylformate decarboxylase [Candidatus Thalassolituus haligoni]|uniref:benzoylformate decarboxylase n=1 Tax=Candidatus Thalassolituus haligoni TaxID=3100113 RepID=UPI0035179D84